MLTGTVTFWINAFIPQHVFGYTLTLDRGAYYGKTAIPVPFAAKAFGNMSLVGSGFLTDQREFSPKPSASVRMQSHLALTLSPPGGIRGFHNTSGTTQINFDGGQMEAYGEADMSRCSHSPPYEIPFSVVSQLYEATAAMDTGQWNGYAGSLKSIPSDPPFFIPAPRSGKFGIMVKVTGQASDPLVRFAADIDYELSFLFGVDTETETLLVGCSGKIDPFPAFESYCSYRGETKTLFQASPPRGNTVVNLVGSANRAVAGAARFGK